MLGELRNNTVQRGHSQLLTPGTDLLLYEGTQHPATRTGKPMKTTYAVTMVWNIRPIDPQEHSEETATILIVSDSEEGAIEQAIASCTQGSEPDDAFATPV